MSSDVTAMLQHFGWLVPLVAAAVSAGLIFILRPILQRYALAMPNARSSHRIPTPQGGGLAVVAGTIVAALLVPDAFGSPVTSTALLAVFAASIFIAMVGAFDDVRPIAVLPRMLLQAAAVVLVIALLPADLRIAPMLPWIVERALLAVGMLWFVNLVNFMDGLDLMTVAEIVPLTGGIILIAALVGMPTDGILVALALLGAMLGFAPFNRPVARLFLGDVGSLPIGLLTAWLLILLASRGYWAAALLLPLYYLADATLTLLRRLVNGEPFWQAHRTHFYQRATDNGLGVGQVVTQVFAVNIALVVLAVTTVAASSVWISATALVAGAAAVGWLLHVFATPRNRVPPTEL